MGRSGGESPTGTKVRWLKTLYLRAPTMDWPDLIHGAKREFRMVNMGVAANAFFAPTPVVLYCTGAGGLKTALVTLAEHRKERLIEIAGHGESLRGEGFTTYDEFRAYWRRRTRRPYDPKQLVEVFRIGAYTYTPEMGESLIERLYGEYL